MNTLSRVKKFVVIFVAVWLVGLYGQATALLLYVGPGEAYETIGAAIADSQNGYTIIVKDGTYTENLDVDKSIHILSENGSEHSTVVSADVNDHLFYVTAADVFVDGFTVYPPTATGETCGITVMADNCAIVNNRCGLSETQTNVVGICLFDT
ncbi:MAG: hypothetical protein SWO11_21385 [Thermodesulfobacteriota bacterium]|nr:hypothetical protein [Thermodesulfobacteriota bacterium]